MEGQQKDPFDGRSGGLPVLHSYGSQQKEHIPVVQSSVEIGLDSGGRKHVRGAEMRGGAARQILWVYVCFSLSH